MSFFSSSVVAMACGALVLSPLLAQASAMTAPGTSPGTALQPSEAPRTSAPTPGSASASPPAPQPPAENASKLTRYDDETPLGYTLSTIVKSVMAHTAPGSGAEVTLLVGGTEIVRVAEHDASVLVLFPDPKDPSARELGWISVSALQPAPGGPCVGKQVGFRNLLGTFCAAPCRDSTTCGPNQACVPAGLAAAHDGKISDLVMYCIAK